MNRWVINHRSRGDSQPFIDLDRVEAIRASVDKAQSSIATVLKQANVVGDKEMEGVLSRASRRLANRWDTLDRLVSEGPTLVLVAGKGTGKTFLSNILCNSWLDYPEANFSSIEQNAIQPVGEGGTTPCEFRYIYSESWAVDIEPAGYAEAWHLVEPMLATIARRKLKIPSAIPVDADEAGTEELFIAADSEASNQDTNDIVSAARISELPPIEIDKERTLKGICFEGKAPSEREIREILTTKSLSAWRDEIVSASNLNHRQGQTMRLRPPVETSDHKLWLRECLIAVLKGRIPKQPYPKCVVVAGPIFPSLSCGTRITIIDTLGLPPGSTTSAIFGRRDLLEHICDDRALLLFAASGENPPEPTSSDIYAGLDNRFGIDDERFSQRHRRVVVGVVFKNKTNRGMLDDDDEANDLKSRCEARLEVCRSELRQKTKREILSGGVHVAEAELNSRFRFEVERGFGNIVEDCILRTEAAIQDVRETVQRANENKWPLATKLLAIYRSVLHAYAPRFMKWQETVREAPLAGLIDAVAPANEGGWLHQMSVVSMAQGDGEGASCDAVMVVANSILDRSWRNERYNVVSILDGFKSALEEKCAKIVAMPQHHFDGVLLAEHIHYLVGVNGGDGMAHALRDLLLNNVEYAIRETVSCIVDSFETWMRDDDNPLWTHPSAVKRKRTILGIWEKGSRLPLKVAWSVRLEEWQDEVRESLLFDADALLSDRLAESPDYVESGWPYPDTVTLPHVTDAD